MNTTGSPISVSNQDAYNNSKTVSFYKEYSRVQAPEKAIFGELEPKLPTLRVLDIGIGGGRTTALLAPKAKHYVGIDYAPEMVEAAKERFPAHDIRWGDATNLSDFADASFDVTLFSFNGIDCVGSNERDRALQEMFRVTVPHGLVIFSAHNLLAVPNLNRVRFHRHPSVVWRRIVRRWKFKKLHGDLVANPAGDLAFVKDGTNDFEVELAYARPLWQLDEIKKQGVTSVRSFALDDGRELNEQDLATDTSTWIYFVCVKA
jgi:ubiquinone/menaquinone biosynthesis C-methylase UbiE